MRKDHSRTRKVLFVIAAIILTSFVCYNILQKPTSDKEFDIYEQVARSVYEQGEQLIYDVPEGIILRKNDTCLIISSSKKNRTGKLIAEVHNGELVFTRKSGNVRSVAICILLDVLENLIFAEVGKLKK